jgi:hypothetical protein
MNYFELYYAYLAQCERENWANMRDPHHDRMEWNHTLPQCIFGDQPIGQWLTIEQHAIASALQTLAFERSCVCGFQKNRMPSKIWELVAPYYSENCSKTAKEKSPLLKLSKEDRQRNGLKGLEVTRQRGSQSDPEVNARRSESLRATLSRPEVRKRKSESMTGDKNPMFGLKGDLCPSTGVIRSPETCSKISSSKKGTRRWVNSEGKWIYRRECPGPGWKLWKTNQ